MKDVNVLTAKRLGITCCERQTTMLEAARIMNEEDISSLIVVDEAGYLAGIITRTDIVRASLQAPDSWAESPCEAWMTAHVYTVEPDASLEFAARLLQTRHVHRVVVVQREEGRLRPIAVISDSDIVYHLVQSQS